MTCWSPSLIYLRMGCGYYLMQSFKGARNSAPRAIAFLFYLDASVRARKANRHASSFERFRLEQRLTEFFGNKSKPLRI